MKIIDKGTPKGEFTATEKDALYSIQGGKYGEKLNPRIKGVYDSYKLTGEQQAELVQRAGLTEYLPFYKKYCKGCDKNCTLIRDAENWVKVEMKNLEPTPTEIEEIENKLLHNKECNGRYAK